MSEFYIGSIEDDIDPSLMQLFRAPDKQIMTSSNANLPNHLRKWVKYYAEEYDEEEDNINVVFYSSPARIIKERLELIGYSLTNAKRAYYHYLDSDISKYKKSAESRDSNSYQSQLKILSSINLDKWLSTPKEIYDKELTQSRYDECFGFSCIDLNVTLRLVLEVLPENENVIYNVTDLILRGYFHIEEDLVKYANNILSSQDYYNYNNSKCIILTEGKSDTLILSESLKLLYPHLSDYFTFMDFDGAKVGGGAGSLATMVKSFSGAGIINRVVAVFDNDTAARAALKGIQNARISNNIKVYTLPDIEILKDYPTIGPSGMVNMNVNGLAGGIEAYLGKSSLTDDDGNFYPVQWTGLDSGLQKYQGEITEKDKVQKKFKEQLNACKENNSLIDNYDWSGVKAILEKIFSLFHEDDGQQIISWAKEYAEEDNEY